MMLTGGSRNIKNNYKYFRTEYDYARVYDEKSSWAKKAEKAEYAKSVKLQ